MWNTVQTAFIIAIGPGRKLNDMNMVAAVKNEITIVRSGGGHSSARISRENYQNIFCNLYIISSVYGSIIQAFTA